MTKRLLVGDDVWAVSVAGFVLLREALGEGMGKEGALVVLQHLARKGHAKKLLVWETSESIH